MTEKQKLLTKVKANIEQSESEDLIKFYNDLLIKYENIEKYLDFLPSVNDKLTIAQWANNDESINKLIPFIQLPENAKRKYDELLKKNRDLNRTINFDILNDKYDFLQPIMDIITTDINIQQRIVSLSEERLELFRCIFSYLQNVTNYPIPYISQLLNTISYSPFENNNRHHYDELTTELGQLVKNGYSLANNDIEKYIFLCNCRISNLPINSIWDLRDFNNIMIKCWENDNVAPQRNSENPDIIQIKAALLFMTYGININIAQKIVNNFNFSNIEITNENKDLIEIYTSIVKIISENDANKLLRIYDEYCSQINIDFDFMQSTMLEEDIKKVFAREITNSTFKANGSPDMVIENIPVYEAGIDFKMVVTSIGAYQENFDNKDNYSDYWNSSIIQTHTSSCSLIANNNLSMATVRNVIFGFSSMNDTMLMDCGHKDLSSSDDSKGLYLDFYNTHWFMSSEDLINKTRSDYNELVYERRDLEKGAKNFKKNPDYIVFIEEYEDFDIWLDHFKDKPQLFAILQKQKQDQENKWQETLKAAKNFDIPIVKINREKCAKNELEKIKNLLNEFKQTLNGNLINEIITQYENNSVGLCSPHEPLKSRYFSNNRMVSLLDEIEQTISNADINLQSSLLESYKYALEQERTKVEEANGFRNNNQSSGINYTQRFAFVEQMLRQNNIAFTSSVSDVLLSEQNISEKTR